MQRLAANRCTLIEIVKLREELAKKVAKVGRGGGPRIAARRRTAWGGFLTGGVFYHHPPFSFLSPSPSARRALHGEQRALLNASSLRGTREKTNKEKEKKPLYSPHMLSPLYLYYIKLNSAWMCNTKLEIR